ncbi:hypothetical protein ACFL3S_01245 [Gemmatimonadota bacterium]
MLNRDQLADLFRTLQKERILTVYVDGVGEDPARRRIWRRRLAHELEKEMHQVEGKAPGEREAFIAAKEEILRDLEGFQDSLPKKGWVGFAGPDGIRHSESVPFQVPNLARWETGPRVAPYIRGLKQLRPMVTVLVDSRRSRIFLYKEGEIEEVTDLRADTFLGDLSDTSAPQRVSGHSGTRGEPASEAAQRFLEEGMNRMLRRVKDVCCEMVEPDGFLMLGGSQDALAMLGPMIPRALERRVWEDSSLYVEMSLAEVKEATREGASLLSKRRQGALLNQVVEQAHASGNGSLGGEETVKALREARVDILILSRAFVEGNPDFAEECVGLAFEQDAEVRVFGGAPSKRLDSMGGGVGARLRYRVGGGVG